MTRDKHTVKFTKKVFSNKEGIQLATPEKAAKYIAHRLKTSVIADLGCGIGGQVIFFAKECKKVYAVDRDPEKLEYARKNCDLYNVNNVEFIMDDALSDSVIKKVSDADIVFSDPARPLTEKERTLENIEPPITEILRLYSGITKNLAFHAPPQMPPARIDLDCEREYMSLNGQLNRLTLYFGGLKRCEKSASVLPDGAWIGSSSAPMIRSKAPGNYMYEPEPSVVKAELLGELTEIINEEGHEIFLYRSNNRRTILTSSEHINSPFFKDSYLVLGRTKNDISEMKNILRSVDAGNVILRLGIQPENYWELRNDLEAGLRGHRTVHLFGFENDVIVCEKLNG